MVQQRITIIGSGFAALTAARSLRKKQPAVHITLIAPVAEFIYLPSLIWIPSGLRKSADLIFPLEPFLKRYQLQFIAAHVTGLSKDGRLVYTDNNEYQQVNNDALIIASGSRFIKKLPGIEHAITLCEGIPAAEQIKQRLKTLTSGTIAVGFGGNPKEPTAMRGGPMFELLFGIDTLLRRQQRRDKFNLIFFSPAPQPGKRLGEKAVTEILNEMKKRDISTQLGSKMVRFESNRIVTESTDFETDLILFMPGLTGPKWLENTSLPLSEGGMIIADAHTRVTGLERVYVAGDSGSFPGPDWMPKQAHMADLQAATSARNLLADLEGKPLNATFKAELICIVDTLDKGILIFRNKKRKLLLSSKLLHYAKRFFEWWYLRQYR